MFQKGLSDGEKQIMYNQLEAVQNQTSTKGEESGVARQKQKKDNVEECVLVEGQLMGKAAYQRKSSIVSRKITKKKKTKDNRVLKGAYKKPNKVR